jgi:crotonobetainyl-CoA:carnitine CoA-transferase CaiB-like acyl-CoA transferase
VLDLTDEKGLFCARLLADMGAEVLRIQKPGERVLRTAANAGKKSIGLNIETEKGRDLLRRLMIDTDILVESFPPRYLDSLGIGYDQLNLLFPQLIMASVTDFGQTGPYRDFKSSNLVDTALGGQAFICGEPGQPPLKLFGSQSYLTACLFAANGILLSLWQRHSTGKGQFIDISIQECLAATLDHVLVRYFYEGEVAQRTGNLYWNNAFRIFPCLDGHIVLSLTYQWETLIEWLDSENMADDLTDRKYLIEAERQRNIDHIISVLEKWTCAHRVSELLESGQLMRFPWANVAAIPEVLENPQLKERGFFLEGTDPDSGKIFEIPGPPFKMSRSPWQVNPGIPQTGEYDRKIFCDRLGLKADEIEKLRRDGVI